MLRFSDLLRDEEFTSIETLPDSLLVYAGPAFRLPVMVEGQGLAVEGALSKCSIHYQLTKSQSPQSMFFYYLAKNTIHDETASALVGEIEDM